MRRRGAAPPSVGQRQDDRGEIGADQQISGPRHGWRMVIVISMPGSAALGGGRGVGAALVFAVKRKKLFITIFFRSCLLKKLQLATFFFFF